MAIAMLGAIKECGDLWKDTEALLKGRPTFLPFRNGEVKQWMQAVIYQVGTGILDLPKTPTVFDISDELSRHQVWSIQLHKAYASEELWKSCEAQKNLKDFSKGKGKGKSSGKDKDKKTSKTTNIAEDLKTLLLSKLQGKDKQLLDEIEAWAGRVGGADEYMYMGALIRIPSPIEEPVRRASGVDGIFFEMKLQGEDREE